MCHSEIILEICAADMESVRAAAAAGAHRIELCSALAEGGVTPSAGFIAEARKICGDMALMVLIRPRGGDFVYSREELECMLGDIELCVRLGADGVVIGALTPEGDIDKEACRRMVSAAGGMSVTFHRAFDMARDPVQALEDVIALGCDRILTSGQAPSAQEGASMLRQLREQAAGRVWIMAGAGVKSSNLVELLRDANPDEVHASASVIRKSAMRFRRDDVKMGAPDADEFSRKTTDEAEVRALVKILGMYRR